MQFKRAGKTGFDRRYANLAVALRAVAVAAGEQRAVGVNGQIERGAGNKFLVVHVAAVTPRRRRRHRPPRDRRRYGHDAVERLERQLETPRQSSDHAFVVEWNVDQALL